MRTGGEGVYRGRGDAESFGGAEVCSGSVGGGWLRLLLLMVTLELVVMVVELLEC